MTKTILIAFAALFLASGLLSQEGCTDSAALNFDSTATIDNNTCVVPGCESEPSVWAYCYDSNENSVIAVFNENNSGDGVTLEFLSGMIESGWDFINIYDGSNSTEPLIYNGSGDLTGLLIQSTGPALAIEIISDGSVSCAVNSENASPAIMANVFCGSEVSPGCTDPLACNYNSSSDFYDNSCGYSGDACNDLNAETADDVYQIDCSCQGSLLGCTDSGADNYDPLAVVDSGDCLYNDYCESAQSISCGETLCGSTTHATSGSELGLTNCGPGIDDPGVWYSVMGNGQELRASTCGNVYDSRIYVFSGTCGDLICEGGNDDSDCDFNGISELQSTVIWHGSLGVEYFIHVSGWNGVLGDFDLSLSCEDLNCEPATNDKCIGAIELTEGEILYGTNQCSYANDNQPSCDPFASAYGVWYEWNSGSSNALEIDFRSATNPVELAALEPAIAIFSGECGEFSEVFCDDVNVPLDDLIVFGLEPETQYYVLVWTTTDASRGEFELTIDGRISGCMVVGACNYNSSATIDDDSCDYSCITDCNNFDLNFDCTQGSWYYMSDELGCVCANCSGEPTSWNYCYDSNEFSTFTFQAISENSQPMLHFGQGVLDNGLSSDFMNIYDGPNNTYPLIEEELSGDLTGLVVQGSTSGGAVTVEIISDTNCSCASGSILDEIQIDLYCAQEIHFWCGSALCPDEYTPELYLDCDDVVNGSNFSCCDPTGCTDSEACNYNPCVTFDDGTCCYEGCVSITITDSFGDGGGSVELLDPNNNIEASVSLDDGSEITELFCATGECVSVVVNTDAFPNEVGVIIESHEGIVLDLSPGEVQDNNTYFRALYEDSPCVESFPGCWNPDAINYAPFIPFECFYSDCCIYQEDIDVCSEAIDIHIDTEYQWETLNYYSEYPDGYYSEGGIVGQTDWFCYTPAENVLATVSVSSSSDEILNIWEGDCLGEEGLQEVLFGVANDGQEINQEINLSAQTTYYFQIGLGFLSDENGGGTLELTVQIPGCTDAEACNYDEGSDLDDGTCFSGGDICDDGDEETEGDVYQDNCECHGVGSGCTDSFAVNFDPYADSDDGSCCFDYFIQVHIMDSFGDGGGGFIISDAESNILTSGELDSGFEYWSELCISDPQCLNFELTHDAFPSEVFAELFINGEAVYTHNYDDSFHVYPLTVNMGNSSDCEVPGCNDASACNFNGLATLDDGTCLYPGDQCEDFLILFYSPDCICVEPVSGDYNFDGAITSSDLTQFLGEYGTSPEGIYLAGDFNGDGIITAADLTGFLSVFGTVI